MEMARIRVASVALLSALLLAAALPLCASAAIQTTTVLTVAENPMKPGFLPYLSATVTTNGGQPLPAGTLTIVKSPSTEVATTAVGGATNSLSAWADGGYEYGDYEFVATYTSPNGGATSSDTLIVMYRDLFPPITFINGSSWYVESTVSIPFSTEAGATSECRLDDGAWADCESPWTRTLADGAYRLEVRSTDSVGNVEEFPAGHDFTVDTTLPTGTFTINGGAVATNNPVVQVTLNGSDNIQPVWTAYYSLSSHRNSGGFLEVEPYGPFFWQLAVSGKGTFPLDLRKPEIGGSDADGLRTIHIQYQTGPIGQVSNVITRTIRLDRLLPTTTAPAASLRAVTALSSGKASLRVSWTGADTGAGVARYELDQSVDGGAWSRVSSSLAGTSTDRSLATGHSYRFRTRAVDKAGNVGAWATGTTFKLTRYSEGNSRLTYKGTWRTSSSSAYLGGAAKYASAAEATASFTFTGRSLGWISRLGPTRGKAEVLVNGVKVATIDLYAAGYQNQRVVWAGSWSTAVSRTITIRVLGTSARPRVDLDAVFAIT
jgi:hypothetical protein